MNNQAIPTKGSVSVVVLVLVLALALASLVSVSPWENGAAARETATWQTKRFVTPFYAENARNESIFNVWIEQLPADCDVETIAQGVSEMVAYYRCPR